MDVDIANNNSETCPQLGKVDEILELAHLSPDTFKPIIQSVQFDSVLQNEEMSLLEVDESVIDYLQEGNR